MAADAAVLDRIVRAVDAADVPLLAQTQSPHEVARLCSAQPPTVLVWGTGPRPPRASALRTLHGAVPHARIVIVTAAMRGQAVRKALDAGADGIVLEHEIEVALGIAVRAVHAGQFSLPRSVREQVEQPVLTFREKQVLGMVVMGFTNSEIARKLYLAESTVKSHLSTAFSKLGVGSRHEAAALILDPEQRLGIGVLAISDGAATEAVA